MALLREYHSAIGKIIYKHKGTLERFAGDGVMVIFNDPVPLPNPALVAVNGLGNAFRDWGVDAKMAPLGA